MGEAGYEPPEYLRCVGGPADGRVVEVQRWARFINIPSVRLEPPLYPPDLENIAKRAVTQETYVRQPYHWHRLRWFLVWSKMSDDDALKRIRELW